MITLAPLVLQLVQMGISVLPEIISAAQQEIEIFNSGGVPTAAEQTAIDDALDKAHAALQNSV